MPRVGRTTVAYLAVVLLLGVFMHTGLAPGVVGATVAQWFQNNSEGFLLALTLPLYWSLMFPVPDNPRAKVRPRGLKSPLRIRVAWYALLLLPLIVLESQIWDALTGAPLPIQVISQREALEISLILSLYFDWSRHSLRTNPLALVPELRSGVFRGIYYLLALMVLLVVYSPGSSQWLGVQTVAAFEFRAETLLGVLIIPLYFDLILKWTNGSPSWGTSPLFGEKHAFWLAIWCSVLIFGLVTSSMASAGIWEGAFFDRFWRRVSEVFFAGLLITLFVELFRQGHPEGSAP